MPERAVAAWGQLAPPAPGPKGDVPMTTSELAGREREVRRPRRGRLAVFAGLFAVVAITIGAVRIGSTDGSSSPTQPVQISVAPGPTYPAALIHRHIAQKGAR
jgi:hypothetical protein